MMTPLDKPLRRELHIDGQPYTLTVAPEGLKLVEKGDARASHCAGRIWYPETLHWPPPCRPRSNGTEPARPPHIGITPPWRYITARTLA